MDVEFLNGGLTVGRDPKAKIKDRCKVVVEHQNVV